MNNERIQVGYVEASSNVQAPEILITGGNSIKIYDYTNEVMGGITFGDADFIFFTDINNGISKSLRNNPEFIEDGTIAHNSVVVHKNNVNETVSGVKTFINNQNFSGNINVSGTGAFNSIDLNNIDNLSLSGIDVSITGSTVNVYGDIFISGNKVLTGSNHTHLWSQSTYDAQIGTSSAGFAGRTSVGALTLHAGSQVTALPSFYGWDGFSNTSFTAATARTNLGLTSTATAVEDTFVRTTGNQTISGVKTFIGNHIISGNTTVSGAINISGNYDLYSQIENTKRLAIAYAIAL